MHGLYKSERVYASDEMGASDAAKYGYNSYGEESGKRCFLNDVRLGHEGEADGFAVMLRVVACVASCGMNIWQKR